MTREIKITAQIQERWIPEFLAMLKAMETLGKVGSSRTITFYSDGDGDFRPKFDWDIDIDCNELRDEKNNIRLEYDAG